MNTNIEVVPDIEVDWLLDYYDWNINDNIRSARKVIDRTTEDKQVHWEYWNGETYEKPSWFEKHLMQVPEIPKFYITDYEKFKEKEFVAIVEGEKDVDNLKELGITATTLGSGSDKINEEQLEELLLFKDKTVFLIGDNDPTGEQYINDLAYKLHLSGYPKAIRKADIKQLWNDVPLKGDISDWIELKKNEGISTEEIEKNLKDFLEDQPKYKPPLKDSFKFRTANEMLDMDIKPLQWLVDDLIPDQGLIQLAGSPKSGKSTFALQLSVAIAQEDSTFLDCNVKHGKVLYVDFENSDRIIKGRLRKQLDNSIHLDNDNLRFLSTDSNTDVKTLNNGFINQLDGYLKQLEYNVVLVVIDTLKHIQSESSKNINLHDTKEIQKLSKYAQEHKFPILLLNHTPKEQTTDGRNPFERSMGSQSVFGAMDTQMILRQNRNENREVVNTTLFITGREVEEAAYVMNMVDGIWTCSGSLSEFLDIKKKNELEENDIGFGIKALLDSMTEGDEWRGTSKDLMDKLEEISAPLDEETTRNAVTRFIKKNRKDLEKFFDCGIKVKECGKNSTKFRILKSFDVEETLNEE